MRAAEKLDRSESDGPYLPSDHTSTLLAVLLMELQRNNDRLQQEVDRLRRDESRPDDELVTRWDVVTIVIALIGGLVTAVAAVLAIAQWVAE